MSNKDYGLGMAESTARSQLLSGLVFNLLSELGLADCFRCNQPLSALDFTIEHKIPWRGSPEALSLYFDYDNVTFSHHACNAGARRETKAVDHGGGKSGKKGCFCDPCVLRRREYRRNYMKTYGR